MYSFMMSGQAHGGANYAAYFNPPTEGGEAGGDGAGGEAGQQMGAADPEYLVPGPMGYSGGGGTGGNAAPMGMPHPMMMGYFAPTRRTLKRADHHVIEKHKSIYPKDDSLRYFSVKTAFPRGSMSRNKPFLLKSGC